MLMPKRHNLKLLISHALMLLVAGFCLHPATVWANKMPDFQLQSTNNAELIQSQNYRGKLILINFWATWCPPCRKEIPSLIELQKQYNTQGFTVIGISVDHAGVEIIRKFGEKMGINYPLAVGTTEITKGFGSVSGIPASFLIDRKGNIAKSYAGYVTHEQLKKDIDALIDL